MTDSKAFSLKRKLMNRDRADQAKARNSKMHKNFHGVNFYFTLNKPFSGCAKSSFTPVPKIIGGHVVVPHSVPYQVFELKNWLWGMERNPSRPKVAKNR